MHASPEFDVAIVGARVAGAATALLLARAGLKVVVLDRTTYGNDTLSTHALMRAGVMQLYRWGLLDDVIASGTPAVRRTTFFVGPDPLVISIKPAYGVDALYAPRRTVLDPMLVDAAAAAGADIRFGVTRLRSASAATTAGSTGLVGHDAGGDARPRPRPPGGGSRRPGLQRGRVGRAPRPSGTGRPPAPSPTATGRASTSTATSGTSARAWPREPSPPTTG